MIITHETTVEQYEAWLATNPPLERLKDAVRSTFAAIYRTIGRIAKRVRKEKRCSSIKPRLSVRTVTPLTYDRQAGYHNWKMQMRTALAETKEHIRLLNLFEAFEGKTWASSLVSQRHKRIARVEEELAMEKLHADALELLLSGKNER